MEILSSIPGEKGLVYFEHQERRFGIVSEKPALDGVTILQPIKPDHVQLLMYGDKGWTSPQEFDLSLAYADRTLISALEKYSGNHGTKFVLTGEFTDDSLASVVHNLETLNLTINTYSGGRLAPDKNWNVVGNLPTGIEMVAFPNRPRELFAIRTTVPDEFIVDIGTRIDNLLGQS